MTCTIRQYELGDRRLADFVRVPWVLFRGDPHWTPPLSAELLGSRLLGMTGLLTPAHPYHRSADVTHFVAQDGRHLLGRVSAAINYRFNEYYGAKIGFFGFFDVMDDYAVAGALLDRAAGWLRDRGMTVLRGPGGYSNAAHEAHQAVLIDGFGHSPTVELTHNPPYYGEFLLRYGLEKAKDYHAYRIPLVSPSERLVRVAAAVRRRGAAAVDRRGAAAVDRRGAAAVDRRGAAAVRKRGRIETRVFDVKHLRAEVDRIVDIYNESWADNWGFLPLVESEAAAMADNLKLVLDPGLMRFATVEGEPAAVLGALPDPNVPLRPRWRWPSDTDAMRALRLVRTRRHIPVMRLMFFGVRPQFRKLGVDALLYHEVQEYAVKHGYTMCEPSLLLEDNDLVLRASASMNGTRYKTWRVYEMPL